MTTRSARAVLVAASAASFLFVAACGDDDSEDATPTTEAAASFDAEGFCAAADVLGNSEAPTADQIDAYRDAAPSEIVDDVTVVADAFAEAVETGDFSGLDSPDVVEATEALQAAELEHCGVVAGEG